MQHIYLVVFNDRHCDPEYYTFFWQSDAVKYAKQKVREYCYSKDFVESEEHMVEYDDRGYIGPTLQPNQFYFAEWSAEGNDTCQVLMVPFIDYDQKKNN